MQHSFEENRLEVEVAFQYYYEQKTQSEIAKDLGLSRIKVQRVLQKCLDSGIVRITIQDPLIECVKIEKELIKRFGLKEAHVVMTPSNGAFTNQQIALKGASVFDSKLSDGMTVGAAWGKMVNGIVKCLEPSIKGRIQFVSLVGGLTTKFSVNPFSIIHKLGELYEADVSYLSAPAVVDSLVLKEVILQESSLESVCQRMKQIDLAVVGIGSVGEQSTLFETGYLSQEELDDFRSKGAIGEVLLFHYDIWGQIVESSFHDRLVGIGVERLKTIDTVIGVAGGEEKVEPIIGAMHGKFINTLITDEKTAEMILSHPTGNNNSDQSS